MSTVLIDSSLIGIVYILAAVCKALDKQWEHVITRLFVGIVYLSIGWLEFDIITARIFSRHSVVLLAVVELISYLILRRRKWKI